MQSANAVYRDEALGGTNIAIFSPACKFQSCDKMFQQYAVFVHLFAEKPCFSNITTYLILACKPKN